LAPSSGETGSGRGQVTSPIGRSGRGLRTMKVWRDCDVAFGRYSTLNFSRNGPYSENTRSGMGLIRAPAHRAKTLTTESWT